MIKLSVLKIILLDPGEASMLELCLSCDNLLCDALGRPPSAKLVISVKNPNEYMWTKYAQTEVAEVCFP